MIEKNTVILGLNDYDRLRNIEQKYLELKSEIIKVNKEEGSCLFGSQEAKHYELDIEIIKKYLNIPQDKKLIIK